ncbi:MAG TPA: hypothetical protein VNF27_06790 [Candidatus Binataceae bacterium]|nr:hypothetical protein [Candidatus Binataceae bacterium]
MRINPGPFEPFVYFLQTRAGFRIVAIGGLVLFTILFFLIAWAHGAGYAIFGLILLAAMLAAWRFGGTGAGVGESVSTLQMAFAAIYILYGLIWMWHRPALGLLFTLWVPLALLSATSPPEASAPVEKPE